MKITLQNEETGLQLILKQQGMLEERAVIAAYELISGRSPGNVSEPSTVPEPNYPLSDLEVDHDVAKAFRETREKCKEDLDPFEGSVKVAKKVEEGVSRPRRVDFVNAGNTLFTPLGDKLQGALDDESREGAQKESDPKEYPAKINVQVIIDCPLCGFEGVQRTYRGNRYAKCRECGEKLFLRPAGREWGELDDEGNEYYASTVYKERALGGYRND